MNTHAQVVVSTFFALLAGFCLWLYWRERQERRSHQRTCWIRLTEYDVVWCSRVLSRIAEDPAAVQQILARLWDLEQQYVFYFLERVAEAETRRRRESDFGLGEDAPPWTREHRDRPECTRERRGRS